ncbi:hypothetical protein AVEN_108195-1 [Araneus ventricosus]|uniref:Uncharacterized protein n=1 Tax=Araneus ventricosus TaxID=182803 RepID=A0A4Y2MI00_ARAVE|nr:hypothetical protein AVEN_108195-1 [Araneus ventricosus]
MASSDRCILANARLVIHDHLTQSKGPGPTPNPNVETRYLWHGMEVAHRIFNPPQISITPLHLRGRYESMTLAILPDPFDEPGLPYWPFFKAPLP